MYSINEDSDPPHCPSCGSRQVAYLVYGLPSCMADVAPKIAAGEVRLAGCIDSEHAPEWHCASCHHEWGVTPLASVLRWARQSEQAATEKPPARPE